MKNQEALFKTTYDLYADDIFRFCYFRTSDRERSKELMQEAFMKTWEAVARGASIGNMRAYVYKAARNLSINEIERRKETSSLEALSEETGFEPEQEALASPERAAEHRMVAEHVHALDGPYRDALVLRYMNGLAVKEIADILGESENVISVRLHRALEKLKQSYEYGT